MHRPTRDIEVRRAAVSPPTTDAPDAPDAPVAPELVQDLRRSELQTIIVVSTLLNSTSLKLRKVLELSMEAITDALDAEAGSIFLLDERRNELEIHVPTGGAGDVLRGIRIPRGHGLVGWVVDNGEPLLIQDAAKDPRFKGTIDDSTGFRTRSVLAVPLKVRGRCIGAIEVLNRREGGVFARSDLAFMGALANQVAIALENARLYSALETAYEEVKQVDDLKSKFIAVAAHELITPITVLTAHVELLEAEAEQRESDPELAQFLDGVRNGIARLANLSHDLINMMMVDRKRLPVEARRIEVATLVEEVVRELGSLARRRRQELTYDLGPPGSTEVLADVTYLKHVLHNLLMNAIRFTDDQGNISVQAAAVDGEVRVSVRDDGIGVSKEEQERIFDKLYSSQPALNHSSGTYEFRSGGLGLGLAIARGVIEAHGGRIWVESEEGKGSTFTFALPAADVADVRSITADLAGLPRLGGGDGDGHG